MIKLSSKTFASVGLLETFLNYRITVEGKTPDIERILKEGNYALAAKHRHWFDPIIMYSAIHKYVEEPPWPFAKKELFEKKRLGRIVSWWYRNVGTIPIDRTAKDGSARADEKFNAAAIIYATEILRSGKAVVFFPEAHRYPTEMGRCYPFIPGALLELRRTAGIDVPVLTVGSEYSRPEQPIERNGWAVIRFGPVLKPSDYEGKNARRSSVLFANGMEKAIAEASNLPTRNNR